MSFKAKKVYILLAIPSLCLSRIPIQSHVSAQTRSRKDHQPRTTFRLIPISSLPTSSDCESLFSETRYSSPLEFNHKFVGVTYPWNSFGEVNEDLNIDECWPSDQCAMIKNCRLIRFRDKVGKGRECYEAIRNVALGWEDLHKGSSWSAIRKVNSEACDPLGDIPKSVDKRVMQIVKGKKMVTVSRVGGLIWAMNPVMGVYDVLDARGKGLTYTSTAYATLKGHLLSGEERVTVAIRDSSTPARPLFLSHGLSASQISQHNLHVNGCKNEDGEVWVEVLSISRPSKGMLGRMIFPFIKNAQIRFFKEEMNIMKKIAREYSKGH